MSKPFVTIIMVTFNSMKIKQIFDEALDHLLKVSYRPLEIIIVDNGSTDGTFDYLHEVVNRKAPRDIRLKLIRLSKNYGFAIANNVGFVFRDKRSKYIALINNDLTIDSDGFNALIKFLEENKDVAGVQGKILTWDGKRIDSAGCFMDKHLGTYTRCQDLVFVTCSKPKVVGYLDGAFSIYRIEAIIRAGRIIGVNNMIFLPYFFMYGDDYELGIRLWRQGYKLIYLPVTVGRHYRSATVKSSKSIIYEYWDWKGEIAIRAIYGYLKGVRILLVFPIILLVSIINRKPIILRGFINGLVYANKLLKKFPRLVYIRESKRKEPVIKVKNFIPTLAKMYLKYGKNASRKFYEYISKSLDR
ncbi:MAG: glycosyltransferase [Caldisphaera sp.]